MTKTITKRLFVIATMLVVFLGGAFFLLQRAKSSEVRPLHTSLNDAVPFSLGNWQGEDQKLDEEITKTVGARHAISRVYTDDSGRAISLHIGDWDSLEHPTLPHPPAICYPATGAKIIGRETIHVGDDQAKAEVLIVQNAKGVESLVLYWYCWDDQVCTTRWEACMTRLKQIGSREWPPVVKVMMDTPSVPNRSEALAVLRQFAGEIRNRTIDL